VLLVIAGYAETMNGLNNKESTSLSALQILGHYR